MEHVRLSAFRFIEYTKLIRFLMLSGKEIFLAMQLGKVVAQITGAANNQAFRIKRRKTTPHSRMQSHKRLEDGMTAHAKHPE